VDTYSVEALLSHGTSQRAVLAPGPNDRWPPASKCANPPLNAPTWEIFMLPYRYKCLLAIASLMVGAALAQTKGDDERMRNCVGALSKGLETGMTLDDYPQAARNDGRTGTAQVQLSVSHIGKMEATTLTQGSGEADIDRAALAAAQRIFPIGATAPAACRLGYGFTVTLAIVFKLLEPQ
jgi:TonB family protein